MSSWQRTSQRPRRARGRVRTAEPGPLSRPPSLPPQTPKPLGEREGAPAPARRPPAPSLQVLSERRGGNPSRSCWPPPRSLVLSLCRRRNRCSRPLPLTPLAPPEPAEDGRRRNGCQAADGLTAATLPPSLPCCSFLPRSRGAKERRDLFELPSSLTISPPAHASSPATAGGVGVAVPMALSVW